MSLGSSLVAIGVYFFKFPNHFSMGGVSGLSILLGRLIPAQIITPGFINTTLNLLFLVLGFAVLNRSFGFRTVYCSLFYSFMVQVLEQLCPLSKPLTDQLLLELFFAVILPALGSALLFNLDASTGGTDIMAMILKKYTGLDVGGALLVSDLLIAAAAFFLFDVQTGLASLLGLALKSVLVDSVIESLNRRKAFLVVTQKPEEVCGFINENLHRGATIWEAHGSYTQHEQTVVLTALSRSQAIQLRKFLRQEDPHAFFLVTNSSEIFGKGFLRA